eukprot:TRINITY_DN753_c0_g1_i2.p1 TRINITY_DN753_c0_g1~~TRINITY_DN753_c0_g1_i2.p1  ORF type:complete len:380 (+),score=83.99 TRINITY_DN753_c0_g1_i2:141-1280(+)
MCIRDSFLYSPAWASVGVAICLVFALTCNIPLREGLGTGVSFWSKLLPQLMSLTPQLNEPDHDRLRPSGNITPAVVSPLRTIVSASDPNWREVVASTIENEPVVVRGLMRGADAGKFGNASHITFDQLTELYGEFEIAVFTHMTKDKSAIKMPFSEYARRMADGEEVYARAIPDLGFFTKNIDLHWLASLISKQMPLWFTLQTAKGGSTGGYLPLSFYGNDKVNSQAHCDIGTSIFLMLQGRKRWLFWPPSETAYMYPYAQQGNVAFNAGVNVFKPDTASYPEFAKARGFEVVLEPGDVMFFPSMWWHAIQNLDPVTVGSDIPMIDPIGSWRRNSLFTACSLLNPMLVVNAVKAMYQGMSARELYFKGYLVDEEQQGTI